MRSLIISGVLGVLVVVVGLVVILWRRQQARRRAAMRRAWDEAMDGFRMRREWLEARFLSLASQSGKPRGLEWIDCRFRDEVTFARDRYHGQLRALVGIIVRFRPEPDSLFADLDEGAEDRVRLATCVFWYEDGEWITDGRALFNLTPHEAIEFLRSELEPVDQ